MEGIHTGAVHGGLPPVGVTPHWIRVRMRRVQALGEGAAEITSNELNTVRNSQGVRLSPGRKERWGKVVLRFDFHFAPSPHLIGNKLNKFP